MFDVVNESLKITTYSQSYAKKYDKINQQRVGKTTAAHMKVTIIIITTLLLPNVVYI